MRLYTTTQRRKSEQRAVVLAFEDADNLRKLTIG